MYKSHLVLIISLIFASSVWVGCVNNTISGGGGSEVVAIVISDNSISGKINTDHSETVASSYEIALYNNDFIPGISQDGKWNVDIASDKSFNSLLDSGVYNLIVTNLQNGKTAIFQRITVANGFGTIKEKELTPSGSVKVTLDSINPVMVYIKGTPFYSNGVVENEVTFNRLPVGEYTISLGFQETIEKGIIPSKLQFSIKSNEESIVEIE